MRLGVWLCMFLVSVIICVDSVCVILSFICCFLV